MPLWVRLALMAAAGAALAACVALLAGFQPVTRLWPFGAYGSTGLGNVFLASVFAAIAAPVAWIAVANEPASIPGGAANILVSGGGIGAYSVFAAAGGRAPAALWLGVASLAAAALALALIVYGLRQPFRDTRPTPAPVRWSFVLFVVLLLTIGGAMVANVPGLFPWPLSTDASVIYGFAFLGAAGYFGYGALRPVWGNAKGQLLAFLAYDLVLIGPYLALWPRVAPELRLSLGLYVTVLLYSGGLAVYYLFIDRRLRLGRQPGPG
jgi:hypothetical protein